MVEGIVNEQNFLIGGKMKEIMKQWRCTRCHSVTDSEEKPETCSEDSCENTEFEEVTEKVTKGRKPIFTIILWIAIIGLIGTIFLLVATMNKNSKTPVVTETPAVIEEPIVTEVAKETLDTTAVAEKTETPAITEEVTETETPDTTAVAEKTETPAVTETPAPVEKVTEKIVKKETPVVTKKVTKDPKAGWVKISTVKNGDTEITVYRTGKKYTYQIIGADPLTKKMSMQQAIDIFIAEGLITEKEGDRLYEKYLLCVADDTKSESREIKKGEVLQGMFSGGINTDRITFETDIPVDMKFYISEDGKKVPVNTKAIKAKDYSIISDSKDKRISLLWFLGDFGGSIQCGNIALQITPIKTTK